MQTLEQLTDASKSAWGTISQWIEHARNHCDVIKKDQSSAERELFTMQMPTSSPMGAVIYETGGILINQVINRNICSLQTMLLEGILP